MDSPDLPPQWLRTIATFTLLLAALAALAGCGVVAVVVSSGSLRPEHGPPTCDGEVMKPDDICEQRENGVPKEHFTYDEMIERRRSATETAPYFIGVGLAAVVVGTTVIVLLYPKASRWYDILTSGNPKRI